MSTFGENVRRLRVARGYATQRAFAHVLGVEQSRLSDWENDRYGLPETANIMKIAKTLGVSVEALLVGVDAEYDAVQDRETGVALVSTNGVETHLSHHPDEGGIHGSPRPAPPPDREKLRAILGLLQVGLNDLAAALEEKSSSVGPSQARFGATPAHQSGGVRSRRAVARPQARKLIGKPKEKRRA